MTNSTQKLCLNSRFMSWNVTENSLSLAASWSRCQVVTMKALETMKRLRLRPGDTHYDLSSPSPSLRF
ncbi:hypothetical protein N9F61_00650 [Akkermansiaceae bacterium]|nr:hypothetical protein [Akkermansiaceae bacterium]MDB4417055.1 hypothetical protein [Akkermansiaceae bacterium]